jgi:hypothetical protein
MQWWDYFKTFTYAFTEDPLSKERQKIARGAGVSQSGAIPDIRAGQDGFGGGGGTVRLRDTNEFIDYTTISNRAHRCKEYERLRSMPEIEMAMTVFADETCLDGDTLIATPHGYKKIKDLVNEKEKFLVYCYDTQNKDYTLGWAYDVRLTKKAKTLKISMDDGSYVICTPDHRIFTKKEEWVHAELLEIGDELMPFYRLPANQDLTKLKTNQFARIYTKKGWKHERQIVDEWASGKEDPDLKEVNRYCRMIAEGLSTRQLSKLTGADHKTVKSRLEKHGFSNSELKWLGKKKHSRRIIRIQEWDVVDVYDMTVEKHHNFCTNWGVVHNCQRDEDGRVFQIKTKNEKIKKELEYLLFHRKMLNLDQKRMWDLAKRLFVMGDFFWEVLIDLDNPKKGIIGLTPLPPETIYRIETNKGRLIEFQQSKEGPDYQCLNVDVNQATDADLERATAIRFAPHQIIHIKLGDDRENFYPYGISLIEPARGPAHQLRLMEDAMVIYRLSRAPERRVFYIDTYSLPPGKAEAFVERVKDQFRKKKVASGKSGLPGASAVEERWHAPAADEDFWIPVRPNSNTRVDTLPGAQNLGEVDDTVYFRNKLFTALNFPKNFFNNEDTQSTRITLSAQDVKFARMIERLQSHIQEALWELCDRHLKLLGFPEEDYEDLQIQLTPPSDWRELTRTEVTSGRIQNAGAIKGSQLMSDFDILTEWMKYPEDQALKMIARLKIQKLEELKLQIIAQNPTLLGVGLPGEEETEVGGQVGGPNPMLGDEPEPTEPPTQGFSEKTPPILGNKKPNSGNVLPEPTEEDIQRFNLDIKDFESEMDEEFPENY